MFTFERRVGRLCELRMSGVLKPEEMSSFRVRAAAVMMAAHGRVVFVSDLRTIGLLSQETFEQLVTMLRTDNPKIERNGLLISNSSITALQVHRLVEESGSPSRRVFRAELTLRDWLGEVLTPEEAMRLAEFIAEGPK